MSIDDIPVSAVARRAAKLCVASGVLFALLLGALHLLEPEFDPTWRFVSEYALGQVGWMMSAAFIALAVNLTTAGVVVAQQSRGPLTWLGLLILFVAAAGFVLAAAFKTDAMTAGGAPSFSGRMHVLGASLDYSPVGALFLAVSLTRHPMWRTMRRWLLSSSGIMIALTVAFVVSMPSDYKFGPGTYTGLIGRFLLLSYLLWTMPLAWHAIGGRVVWWSRQGR